MQMMWALTKKVTERRWTNQELVIMTMLFSLLYIYIYIYINLSECL